MRRRGAFCSDFPANVEETPVLPRNLVPIRLYDLRTSGINASSICAKCRRSCECCRETRTKLNKVTQRVSRRLCVRQVLQPRRSRRKRGSPSGAFQRGCRERSPGGKLAQRRAETEQTTSRWHERFVFLNGRSRESRQKKKMEQPDEHI